ncbi:hypothetical protein EX30DRAFT_30212 [Ascodesmis nigricans]|uniref:Alpha/beta-hydrolase n=1 Tax=Ascodesmis nigricans TaxID=341454 RepID=A0A4S2N8K7_9PEZI|nr:hypothetical protein EX30DRAFT_30212 [Ascodesmis nigricans]
MSAFAAFTKRTITALGFTGTSNSSKPYDKILTHQRVTRPGSFEYVTIVNHNPTTPTKHTIYALQGRERGLDARGVGQWEELAVKYNVHVVLHNYPGYGGDYVAKPRVKCDEVTLKEDCVELLEVLKAEPWFKGTEVIVLGNSIGTGPAMWMASENSHSNLGISKLVLISAYTNLGDFLFRPIALLLRRFFPIADIEPFPTLHLASQLRDIHVLTVHGDQDTTIPFSHFEAINNALEANTNISVYAPDC